MPMSTASARWLPTWATSPRNPMSAIWGWAQLAEQPEKCIRMTPASSSGPDRAPGDGRGADRLAGQLLVEEPGPLDRPLLGLDDGVAAELGPGAGHHPPGERPGVGRVLLEQVLGQQGVDPVLGHAGEGEVLVGADAHGAVAVGLGQAGRLDQLEPVHPPDRDRAAHVEQARPPSGRGRPTWSPRYRRVRSSPAGTSSNRARAASSARKPSGPELLDQVAHAGQAPVLAVAQLAEELGDGPGDLDGLVLGARRRRCPRPCARRRTAPRRPAG